MTARRTPSRAASDPTGRASVLATELAELVGLPTVAGADVVLGRAADLLARRSAAAGLAVVPAPRGAGPPLVLAERAGAPGAPTVLLYGHYDVVPPGPGWSGPPFVARRRGDRLRGRGAVDDKGPLLACLHALDRLGTTGSRVGIKVLFEGEEEVGSPHLPDLLARLGHWLHDVDVVLVCDTEATSSGVPTLTCSLRGQLTVELAVTGAGRALHAGRYGGAVPNPAQALAALLASLHRPDGSVAVAGFYSAVRAVAGEVGDHEDRLRPVASRGWGEPGRSATDRTTVRPAVVVNTLCAGRCAPGPWHVIPASATATVNIRLVPDQLPGQVRRLLAGHLARRLLPGVRLRLRPLVQVRPWTSRPGDGWAMRRATVAVRAAWGVDPVRVRSGGTVPVVPLLAAAAPRAACVLLGFGLPSENAHGPDEHVDLRRLDRACDTVAHLLDLFGEVAT